MTREQLIEKIADCVDEAYAYGGLTPREAAQFVIPAIEAAGLRIVPAEATTAQLYAGQRAWLADAERKSSTLYRAMVAASPIAPKGDSQ